MPLLRSGFLLAAVLGCTSAHAARVQELPAAVPAPAPMSVEEESLTRLLARKDLIGGIVSYCARTFPANKSSMRGAYAAWQQSHKATLDRAAIVMMTRTGRGDASVTGALVSEEQQKLQAWTADSLGIAQDRKPTAEDCVKIARSGIAARAGRPGWSAVMRSPHERGHRPLAG